MLCLSYATRWDSDNSTWQQARTRVINASIKNNYQDNDKGDGVSETQRAAKNRNEITGRKIKTIDAAHTVLRISKSGMTLSSRDLYAFFLMNFAPMCPLAGGSTIAEIAYFSTSHRDQNAVIPHVTTRAASLQRLRRLAAPRAAGNRRFSNICTPQRSS
jgi:hypothetical protein